MIGTITTAIVALVSCLAASMYAHRGMFGANYTKNPSKGGQSEWQLISVSSPSNFPSQPNDQEDQSWLEKITEQNLTERLNREQRKTTAEININKVDYIKNNKE